MSEKVLGFYKKDIEKTIKDWKFEAYTRFPSKEERYFMKTVVGIENLKDLFEEKQVPVRLASESVDLKWLEKYVKHIRGCFEKNQPSDFEAGEETGRIEGLEVLLAEAKKEARK